MGSRRDRLRELEGNGVGSELIGESQLRTVGCYAYRAGALVLIGDPIV